MYATEKSLALKLRYRAGNKNIFLTRFAFSIAFAAAMAISANISIYLPGTPVPITLQTMTVLLSALFLGSKFALLSQFEYIMLGVMGFPVFAGFKNGIFSLLGPTGGYILGFLFASYITGYIFEKFSSAVKNKIYLCLFSFISGLIIIYLTGYIHLLGYTAAIYGNMGIKLLLSRTFDLAVKPFILVEFVKLFIIMDTAVLIKSNRKLLSFHRQILTDKEKSF
jgi:biotin transport system substrate-specific component